MQVEGVNKSQPSTGRGGQLPETPDGSFCACSAYQPGAWYPDADRRDIGQEYRKKGEAFRWLIRCSCKM